jgi:hypothetical protein
MRIASGLNSPIKNRCQANTEWVFRKSEAPKNRAENPGFFHFFKKLKAGIQVVISSGPAGVKDGKYSQIQTVSQGRNTVATTT